MTRKINELVFFGSETAERKMLVMREQLDLAMSYAGGMQQGLAIDDPEYKRGEEMIRDALRDLAAGLLGREITFTSTLPYPNPEQCDSEGALAVVIDKGFQIAQALGYAGSKLHYMAAVLPNMKASEADVNGKTVWTGVVKDAVDQPAYLHKAWEPVR